MFKKQRIPWILACLLPALALAPFSLWAFNEEDLALGWEPTITRVAGYVSLPGYFFVGAVYLPVATGVEAMIHPLRHNFPAATDRIFWNGFSATWYILTVALWFFILYGPISRILTLRERRHVSAMPASPHDGSFQSPQH